MKQKTGYENIAKILKNHLAHCKIHEFSLQSERRCTCGVEKAREELERMAIVWNRHWEEMQKKIMEQD